MTWIFRAMEDEHGMPKLGATAITLGVRRGKDIVPDQSGLVHRPLFVPGEPNGLSCAPTISDLPRFALPVEWGGRNKKTKIWQVEVDDLPNDSTAQEDTIPGKRRHVSVGPSHTMSFDDYVRVIESTRPKWRLVAKPGP